jgi:hypothetical protein
MRKVWNQDCSIKVKNDRNVQFHVLFGNKGSSFQEEKDLSKQIIDENQTERKKLWMVIFVFLDFVR